MESKGVHLNQEKIVPDMAVAAVVNGHEYGHECRSKRQKQNASKRHG